MNRGSLQLRLLMAGAVSILLALTLSGFALTVLFQRHVERRVESELGVYLNQIVAGIDRSTDATIVVARPPADPRFENPLSGLYWQVQAGDRTLRSRSLWDAALALPRDELADGALHRHHIAGPAGQQLIALERSVTLPARLGGGTVRIAVAVDTADVALAARAFAVDLLPYLGVLAVFLLVAGYVQVAVGLRPLTAVRRRLAAIRKGGARRLGKTFPDEILPLASEVDALLDARDTQIEKARTRAGDLAHGLKTPLQVLTGEVEQLRADGHDERADEIEAVAIAMQRHVDREIARARVAATDPDAHADAADVVRRVIAVVSRTPSGKRLEWETEIPSSTVLRIDPDDLAEAIGNLVENAARYARNRIVVRAADNETLIDLTVADDGPGIPEDRLEAVLSRGVRLDLRGGSAGLGLAIVRDIAEASNGSFDIRSTSSGTEAILRLQRYVPEDAGKVP